MNTFENIYNRYKNYFIHKNGQAKFNKIEEKMRTSGKIAQVNGLSIQAKIAPSRADFSAGIHEMSYFIFAGAETIAMAEFIAIKYWNEEINTVYKFCTEHQLFFKGEAILNNWKIRV